MIAVGIAGFVASLLLGRDWKRTRYPPCLFWSGFYLSVGLVCVVIQIFK